MLGGSQAKLCQDGASAWGWDPQLPALMGSLGVISLLEQGAKTGGRSGVL